MPCGASAFTAGALPRAQSRPTSAWPCRPPARGRRLLARATRSAIERTGETTRWPTSPRIDRLSCARCGTAVRRTGPARGWPCRWPRWMFPTRSAPTCTSGSARSSPGWPSTTACRSFRPRLPRFSGGRGTAPRRGRGGGGRRAAVTGACPLHQPLFPRPSPGSAFGPPPATAWGRSGSFKRKRRPHRCGPKSPKRKRRPHRCGRRSKFAEVEAR